MKQWWARIREGGDYGRWIPTGTENRKEAEDYAASYYTNQVIEWLLW